jgi:mannose-6-phosphate isomerase-like protein (cupin superfamily)
MPIYHNQLDTLPTDTERVFRTIFNAVSGSVPCSLHENVLVPYAVIPLHRHSVAEVLVCLSGTAECSVGDAAAEKYAAGSVVVIPPNTLHTIRNTGDTPLRQLSFFAGDPPNTQWLEAPGSVDHVAT